MLQEVHELPADGVCEESEEGHNPLMGEVKLTFDKENIHFISLQLTYFVYLKGNKQCFYGKYNRQKTRNSRVE